jgi:SAM-dependent methyltransferase
MKIKYTPEGKAYLNIGCGSNLSDEWTNIDIFSKKNVDFCDIRKPLPYPNNVFNAVYSSHTLEHLTKDKGEKLILEIYRILKKGGICRIVVPDTEKICIEYLKRLNKCISKKTENNIKNYNWIKLMLIDQMVREKSGGLMLDILKTGDFDMKYVKLWTGDEFFDYCHDSSSKIEKQQNFIRRMMKKLLSKTPKDLLLYLFNKIRFLFFHANPQKTGEAHKWMYDRLSLKLLLEKYEFINFSVKKFDESRIKYWERYNLDKSIYGNFPRKPESIYVECEKSL